MTRIERGLAFVLGFGVFLISYRAFLFAYERGAIELWLIAAVLFGCAWGITSHGVRSAS